MKKQIRIFSILVSSIVFLVVIYLSYQIIGHADASSALKIIIQSWIFIVAFLVVALPLLFWTKPNRGETKKEIYFQIVAYTAQGYFSYLLFLTVLRDLIFLIASLFQIAIFDYSLNEAIFILTLPFAFSILGQIPILWGPFIKNVAIQVPNLAKDLQGFRIAQISDLHIGPGLDLDKVKQVVRKTNQLQPDIIVLTGDIVDHLDKWFVDEINELQNLKAQYGVYYVPGNHEYYWGIDQILHKLNKIGLTILINSNHQLKVGNSLFAVCGVTDPTAKRFNLEGPNFEKAKLGAHDSNFHLLLSHQSSLAEQAAQFGFDLQLSGHTHGGQFIPWSLIIRLFQKYPKGWYQLQNMQLYVNQGTGYWGPRDRLGTLPEISLITLGSSKL